jgi:hypothetical protein
MGRYISSSSHSLLHSVDESSSERMALLSESLEKLQEENKVKVSSLSLTLALALALTLTLTLTLTLILILALTLTLTPALTPNP